MSIASAAELVAGQIARQEYIEVYAHHDADGIASASILCHAMLRAGIRFRLRISARPPVIGTDVPALLCDFGAGAADLPPGTMVVDHHLPQFTGQFHVNPELDGMDGDRELSAAGTAYLVAQHLGDNRDLAGLVMLGIIGDGQELSGTNLEIFNEGVANGIISPGRGMRLTGRDTPEQLYLTLHPYLDGISGEEGLGGDLIDMSTGKDSLEEDVLLSLLVLTAGKSAPLASLKSLYGNRCTLEREVIDDAGTLAAIVDACGKSGHTGLAASLCLRNARAIDDAWEMTRIHRLNVIHAVRAAQPLEGSPHFYEVQDPDVASDAADVLSADIVPGSPIAVLARRGESCHISVRAPHGGSEIGSVVRDLAAACGGTGGGHRWRAGATIPAAGLDRFRKEFGEAVPA